MQPADEAALALWQANRFEDRAVMEARLREFFGPTADEYDRIQYRVSEIFTCPVELKELSA